MELAVGYFGRGQLDDRARRNQAGAGGQARPGRGLQPARPDLREHGRDALAEESFRRALQLDPRDADTMHNYGWFLCQQRRYAEADAQFQQALGAAAVPRHGAHAAGAGRVPGARRPAGRGRAHAVAGLRARPGEPGHRAQPGRVLYRRGEFERARFYIAPRQRGAATTSNAQTLWLAARIENRLGNRRGVAATSAASCATAFRSRRRRWRFERGRFDD